MTAALRYNKQKISQAETCPSKSSKNKINICNNINIITANINQ